MTNVEKILAKRHDKAVATLAKMEMMYNKKFANLINCEKFNEQTDAVDTMLRACAVFQIEAVGHFSPTLANASKIARYAEKFEEIISGEKCIKISSKAVVFCCLKAGVKLKSIREGTDYSVPMIRKSAFFGINALTFNLRN